MIIPHADDDERNKVGHIRTIVWTTFLNFMDLTVEQQRREGSGEVKPKASPHTTFQHLGYFNRLKISE